MGKRAIMTTAEGAGLHNPTQHRLLTKPPVDMMRDAPYWKIMPIPIVPRLKPLQGPSTQKTKTTAVLQAETFYKSKTKIALLTRGKGQVKNKSIVTRLHGQMLQPSPLFSKALMHELQHELLRNYSAPGVDGDFHATDLLVDVFHELHNEVNQLVLPQLFQVSVSHKKADIEALAKKTRDGEKRAWLLKSSDSVTKKNTPSCASCGLTGSNLLVNVQDGQDVRLSHVGSTLPNTRLSSLAAKHTKWWALCIHKMGEDHHVAILCCSSQRSAKITSTVPNHE